MTERLFIALWPPAPVVAEVAAHLPRNLDALRWQPANRWHVTLAFLGQRSARAQLDRLEHLTVPEPGPLRLEGAGTFGPVLWIGVSSGPWLATFARHVQAHFDVPDRRFRAHVTISRARSDAAKRQLGEGLERLKGFASRPWIPADVTLVRSTTGSNPSYEVIGRVGFVRPC